MALVAQLWVRSLRWAQLLPEGHAGRIPTRRLVPVVLVGYLGNGVLPARLGDPIRALLVGRRESVPASSAFGSIVLERVVDTPTAWVRSARSAISSAIAAALEACPLLRLALPFVGHVATRQKDRGTVGGSIAHADAAAELPLLLQTLGGEVEVTGPSGARLVPSPEFFVSHLTSCLEADEIVTEVRFPATGAGWGAGFAEVAPRHGDYAVCAVACALRMEGGVVAEARLGAGAVSDRPLRLDAAERALVGSRCDADAVASAAD